jgi:signal transduction histidine kinase
MEYPLQRNSDCKGVLKVSISDTGVGMSSEELSKLFKKFSQVSNNTAHRQIGTGLGLYITKEIIDKMNGEIRAYSQPEVGTTFTFCIPTFYSTTWEL